MSKKAFFATLFAILTVCCVSAQKLQGDLSPLSNQDEVNLILDFSETLVNGGDFDKFFAAETKGKSESFKEDWLADWNEKLPAEALSKLTGAFNITMRTKFFSIGEYKNAQYTIIVKVKDITPGTFAGPLSKPSKIKTEVSFVKKGEKTPFATVEYKESRSSITMLPQLVMRISMSFMTLGEDLSATISRELR